MRCAAGFSPVADNTNSLAPYSLTGKLVRLHVWLDAAIEFTHMRMWLGDHTGIGTATEGLAMFVAGGHVSAFLKHTPSAKIIYSSRYAAQLTAYATSMKHHQGHVRRGLAGNLERRQGEKGVSQHKLANCRRPNDTCSTNVVLAGSIRDAMHWHNLTSSTRSTNALCSGSNDGNSSQVPALSIVDKQRDGLRWPQPRAWVRCNLNISPVTSTEVARQASKQCFKLDSAALLLLDLSLTRPS